MKNQAIIGVIIAVVFGAGGYYMGTQSATAQQPAGRTGQGGTFAGRGTGRTGGNNAVFGTILAKDANGITVQLGGPNATSTNGNASGTRIVLVNDSTQIMKTTSGSATDLTTGEGVLVTGTPNSDGSLTATSVQIRPAGAGFGGRPNGQ